MTIEDNVCIRNNISLHYKIWGNLNNPKILLICGLSATIINWDIERLIMPMIENNYCVITYDHRGIGKSSRLNLKSLSLPSLFLCYYFKWILLTLSLFVCGFNVYFCLFFIFLSFINLIQEPFTLNHLAEDANLLLEKLNINEYHIIGSSMGGLIAQIMCLKYPNKIKSLTLLSSLSSKQTLQTKPPLSTYLHFLKRKNSSPLQTIIDDFKFCDKSRQQTNLYIFQKAKDIINYNHYKTWISIQCYQLLAIWKMDDITKLIKNISQKTLIISGDKDNMVPYQNSIILFNTIPNSTIYILKNFGHILGHYSNKDITNYIIKHIKSC